MKLDITYNGTNQGAFEGDLPFVSRGIPVGARIQRAIITLQPVLAPGNTNFFEEHIDFTDPEKQFGALVDARADNFEVNFNKRRTLVKFRFNGFSTVANQTKVLVDVGAGNYMNVAADGTLLPPPNAAVFQLDSEAEYFNLPKLEVTRFRVIGATITDIDTSVLQEVVVRSTLNNVNVRLGDQGPFWTIIGTMANQSYQSTDFAAILNLFLATAKQVNGFYILPITVHSDAVARLDVKITIEYILEKNLLPANLPDITMPYDYDGVPSGGNKLQTLRLPRGSRIMGASATVEGKFEDSRIIDYEAVADLDTDQTRKVRVTKEPLAQVIVVDEERLIDGIDLLMTKETPGSATIEVAIHEDDDGKPSPNVLLPNQKIDVFKPPTGKALWVHLALTDPFRMLKNVPYWLVVQTEATDVSWRSSETAPIVLEQAIDLDIKKPELDVIIASFSIPVVAQTDLLISEIELPIEQNPLQSGALSLNIAIYSGGANAPSQNALVDNLKHVAKKAQSTMPSLNNHVQLPFPLHLYKGQVYWLVIKTDAKNLFWRRGAEGQTMINVAQLSVLQRSQSRGLAWRNEYTVLNEENTKSQTLELTNPLKALHRLRQTPNAFSVPLQLRIGDPGTGVRHKFDAFAPLGRVEYKNVDIAPTVRAVVASDTHVANRTKNLLLNGSFDEPLGAENVAADRMALRMGVPRYWKNDSISIVEPSSEGSSGIRRSGEIGRLVWQATANNNRVAAYLYADEALAAISQRVDVRGVSNYQFSFFYQTDFSVPGTTTLRISDSLNSQQQSQIKNRSSIWVANSLMTDAVILTIVPSLRNGIGNDLRRVMPVSGQMEIKGLPESTDLIGISLQNDMVIDLPRESFCTGVYILSKTDGKLWDVTFYDDDFSNNSISGERINKSTAEDELPDFCDKSLIKKDGVWLVIPSTEDGKTNQPIVKKIVISNLDLPDPDTLVHAMCFCYQNPGNRSRTLHNALPERFHIPQTNQVSPPLVEIAYSNEKDELLAGIEPFRAPLSVVTTNPLDSDGMFRFQYGFTPPKEAAFATFRFIQGQPGLLIIDDAVLLPTGETLQNAHFEQWEQGVNSVKPLSWDVSPLNTTAIQRTFDAFGGIGGALLLGSDPTLTKPVEMIQVSPAEADHTYELRLQIAVQIAAGLRLDELDENLYPKVYVEWLSGSGNQLTPIDSPIEVPLGLIEAGKLEQVIWVNDSPNETTHVKIKFVQPIGDVDFRVSSVSLNQLDTNDIPFTFLSQAPGDLVVRDLRISYDPLPEIAAGQGIRLFPSGLKSAVPDPNQVAVNIAISQQGISSPFEIETNKPVEFQVNLQGLNQGSPDAYDYVWEITDVDEI